MPIITFPTAVNVPSDHPVSDEVASIGAGLQGDPRRQEAWSTPATPSIATRPCNHHARTRKD